MPVLPMSCRYSHRLPSENALLALLFGQELTSNQSKSAKRKMPMTTVWHPRCNSFNIFIFSTSHDQAELGTNWTNRSTPHRQWRGSHSGLHPVTVQTAKWLPHSPKKKQNTIRVQLICYKICERNTTRSGNSYNWL